MNVRELIDKLSKCNPDATVCVEAWMSPEAKVVKEFETEIGKCVYIGDDLDNLEYETDEFNRDDYYTPCDYGDCPYNAEGGYDCRNYCGLGVDESEEDDFDWLHDNCDYTPSATNGDYGPSNPWDAPGMSPRDFI